MENHDKKTITIKNALVSDKDFIETTRLQLGEKATLPEALSKIVKCAIGYEGMKVILAETKEETGKLKAEILRITETVNELHTALTAIREENNILVNFPKTIEVIKEVEKTVSKPLTGSQFICELDEQTALNVRKVRSFAKKDGYVTGDNYPNELVNVATNYFLNRIYV